jgi:4-amino-4-deoxy-L-arabinose transferase-like glycosyltransferase
VRLADVIWRTPDRNQPTEVPVAADAGQPMRAAYGGQVLAMALLFLSLSLLLRLPYFFKAVIQWDESTFILMGQEILDGRLPYTNLWDVKPPLAFLAYAASIVAFGHTIEGIRLAGTLCIAATALMVYAAARQVVPRALARVAGIATIIAMLADPSGQATITEHFAVVFLMAGLTALLTMRSTCYRFALAGALLAAATLVRLNLAYSLMAVAIAAALQPGAISRSDRFVALGAMLGGALCVVMPIALPYLLTGQTELLFKSAISAPLAYSQARFDAVSGVLKLGMNSFARNPLLTVLIWGCGLIGVLRLFAHALKRGTRYEWGYWVAVVTAGTSVSVALSGAAHPHYLLQLVPLYVLAFVSLFNKSTRPTVQIAGILALTIALAPIVLPVITEYSRLAQRVAAGEPLRTGRAWELARFLSERNPEREPVLLLEDHIAYWLTETQPLSRMSTHPSNIAKRDLIRVIEGPDATPASEVERVFTHEPIFVVRPERISFFRNEPAALERLDGEIRAHYRLAARIQNLQIYERSTRAGLSDPGTGEGLTHAPGR